MSSGSVTAIAAVGLPDASTAPQPTNQQAAHFAQLLQAPTAPEAMQYQPSPVQAAGLGEWHSVLNHVGEVGDEFHTQLESMSHGSTVDTSALDPQQAAAVQAMEDGCDKSIKLSYSMMSFNFITGGERIANDNIRALYQQN